MSGSIVLTGRAGEVRRAVGPLAWVVLEELVTAARREPGGRLATPTNVRTLAADLGIGKDTAAGALRRLVAVGLVTGEERRSAGGRFAQFVYVIEAAAPITVTSDAFTTNLSRTTRRRHPSEQQQLSLLDPPADPASRRAVTTLEISAHEFAPAAPAAGQGERQGGDQRC